MSPVPMRGWMIIFASACAVSSFDCQDPGCIRNSECGDGFACEASQCVLESTDAARRAGEDDELDASAK